MLKKLASLTLVLCMALSLCVAANAEGVPADQIKVGYIMIGDENEGYTQSHLDSLKEAAAALGLKDEQVIVKYNIGEGEASYEAAADLADSGCSIIFSNSFGHESYMVQAATEFPNVQFCPATGVTAANGGLENVHNYFTHIYQARYLSGVVGGLKLNQMIEEGKITAEEAKVGYVAAKPFEEVISGFTSFFLGVRSMCPTATMEVKYTNEWSDMALESEAAVALIANKCVLISQHSDTTGPSTACEAAGVNMVGYNISMIPTAPTTALVSPTNHWEPFIELAIQAVIDGKGNEIPKDWCGGFDVDAVRMTELNEAVVAPGTAEKVAEIKQKLIDGSLQVFDCSTFTVGGEPMTTCTDVFGFEGVELVKDGVFQEGIVRSAPCFNKIIDGITVI